MFCILGSRFLRASRAGGLFLVLCEEWWPTALIQTPKHLKSGGKIRVFSQVVACLASRFLEWLYLNKYSFPTSRHARRTEHVPAISFGPASEALSPPQNLGNAVLGVACTCPLATGLERAAPCHMRAERLEAGGAAQREPTRGCPSRRSDDAVTQTPRQPDARRRCSATQITGRPSLSRPWTYRVALSHSALLAPCARFFSPPPPPSPPAPSSLPPAPFFSAVSSPLGRFCCTAVGR